MSDAHAIARLLRELADCPSSTWRTALAERVDDPAVIAQALLWLRADLASDPAPPVLDDMGARRYELVTRLDTGATASVWRARDRKLGRDVAIKLFRPASDAARVLAEARATCEVSSASVVRVLDVHDGAPPYIVMELIGEHDPERDQLVLGAAASVVPPRDAREVTAWLLDIARGVHDAHVRGVFHLDLKPRNVLVTPISRRAWVADFGLAASAHAEPGDRIGGTPEYMSPEQARGLLGLDPRRITDRQALVAVDVWGLGALGYALLLGRPPWQASADVDAWELAVSGRTPPISSSTRWGTRIPRPLRSILKTCLALDPLDRYPSAAHVARDLAAVLEGRSAIVRAGSWAVQRPALAASCAAAIVLAFSAIPRLAKPEARGLAANRPLVPHQIVFDETPPVIAVPRHAPDAATIRGRVQPRTAVARRDGSKAHVEPRPVRTATPLAAPRLAGFIADRPGVMERTVELLRAERDQAIAERDRVRQDLARALDRLESMAATVPAECPSDPSRDDALN